VPVRYPEFAAILVEAGVLTNDESMLFSRVERAADDVLYEWCERLREELRKRR
jgi:hypothetical protein